MVNDEVEYIVKVVKEMIASQSEFTILGRTIRG